LKSVMKVLPFKSSEPWIRSNRVPVTNLFSWLDDFWMTMMNDDIAYLGWRWSLSGSPHVPIHLYEYHFRTNTNQPNQLHAVDPYWETKNRQLVKFCRNWSVIIVVSILSQMDLFGTLMSCNFKIDFNMIYLGLGLTGGLFLSGFEAKNLYEFFVSVMRSSCLVHLPFILLPH
jgi:hypothetical protein